MYAEDQQCEEEALSQVGFIVYFAGHIWLTVQHHRGGKSLGQLDFKAEPVTEELASPTDEKAELEGEGEVKSDLVSPTPVDDDENPF